METEILLTKLKYFDSKGIFEWLENDYSKNKNKYNTADIENNLAQKNDSLINLGLLLYGRENDVLLNIYNETNDISLKIAYLNSQKFRLGTDFYLAEDLLKKYVENESEENTKLIQTFFSNSSLSDRLLIDLFEKEKLFNELDENTWLKIISFMCGNQRFNTPYKSTYLNGHAEYSYNAVFTAFWKLYEKLDVNIENAQLLNSLADKMIPDNYQVDIDFCLNRWKSNDENLERTFKECRYYIAKLIPYYDLTKYENSEDKALRRAYYSSNFCSNLSTKDDGLYKTLEMYFDRDGDDFINEVLYNDTMYVNKVRRKALGRVCSYSDKDAYLTNPNFFNFRCKHLLNNFPQWFIDEENEDENYIEKLQDKEIRTEQYLKKIYENVSMKEDTCLKKELEKYNENINTLSNTLTESLTTFQNILSKTFSSSIKISVFTLGLLIGIIVRSFF